MGEFNALNLTEATKTDELKFGAKFMRDKFTAGELGYKFNQIYADKFGSNLKAFCALKFDSRGSNLKNDANLTQPPKGKFK